MNAPRRRLEPSPTTIEEARLRNVPPQNLAAEQAILGGVLLKMSLLDKLGVELRPADFYSPAHGMIWEAMLGLWRASKPVDLVTLAAALTDVGKLDAVGGPAYLADLAGSTISPANSLHHAGIVRAMAKRRAMLDMAMRMMEIAYDPERDPGEFVDVAAKASEAVLKDRLEEGGETPADFLDPYTLYLESLGEAKHAGVATPFWKLNELIRGFQPGEFVVIGARPSHGKTALALTFAEHALAMRHPTGFFSLEMTRFQILNRLFSSAGGVAAQRFRDGKFSDKDWSRIYAQCQIVKDWPLYLYDKSARRPSDIRAACRRWKREGGLDIVFIDYAQLIPPDGRHQTREQEIASVSRDIKAIGKDLEVAMVLLAQVNRDVEKRTKKTLVESDLRESGAIEQDADIIMLIQPWDKQAKDAVMFTTLTVPKSRNTLTGSVPVAFNREIVRFEQDDRQA